MSARMAADRRVEHWDDERSMGNSLIVTLNRNFRFSRQDVENVQGFDTVREAETAVRRAVACACTECQAVPQ